MNIISNDLDVIINCYFFIILTYLYNNFFYINFILINKKYLDFFKLIF